MNKEHSDLGGDKGPSSDPKTGIGGDKGPSPVRKDNEDRVSGIESGKGSSPVDFASSGIYAGKSAKSGKEKWGVLEEEDILKKDDKDPKDVDEDNGITADEDDNKPQEGDEIPTSVSLSKDDDALRVELKDAFEKS